MKRIVLVNPATAVVTYSSTWSDSAPVPTALGPKAADQITPMTRAQLTHPGGSENGDVTYVATFGGPGGNAATVQHTPGTTGPGQENRDLVLQDSGSSFIVLYATDEVGDAIVPTAEAVAALVNGNEFSALWLTATAGGDGQGAVGVTSPVALSGGLTNGDCLKIVGNPPSCHRIARVEDF